MELIFALDLLLLGALFWTLILQRWEAALGALFALTGSLPLLFQLMSGTFQWGTAALCVLTTTGGALIAGHGLSGS